MVLPDEVFHQIRRDGIQAGSQIDNAVWVPRLVISIGNPRGKQILLYGWTLDRQGAFRQRHVV